MTMAITTNRDGTVSDPFAASTPIIPSIASATPAERYLALRVQAITRTHQQELSDFYQRRSTSFPTVQALMEDYFKNFAARVRRERAAFIRELERVDKDTQMDYRSRQVAKQKLKRPSSSAWDEAKERGFVNTYGEPREEYDWNSTLQKVAAPSTRQQINGQQRVVERTAWERFIPFLLEHPETDGSVAPCVAVGFMAPAAIAARATQEALGHELAAVPGAVVDEAYADAMRRAMRSVCPHCHEIKPRNLRQHEIACAKRHGLDSVFDARVKAGTPSDEPDDDPEPDDEPDDEPVVAVPTARAAE